MQPIYTHKQNGTAMLFFIGIPVVILLAIGIVSGQPIVLPPLIFVIALLAAVMVIFSSLAVRVDVEQVTFHFGPGVFRRAFPVRQIREARVVRNPLWYGLGIHFIPGGMVYNVSGLGAVELVMENGRRVRIGSDEPEALVRAVEEAMLRR